MRVAWDESRCALSALCTGLAPDVFRVDGDARLTFSTELDETHRPAVQDAADSCPTQAITVSD
ncbi:MAG TPA: ferredoxin [Mycobacterium sp.]|nr:ferredoxin [Mycobacterium sp.]